ncbi:MAG TPA: efflux RND transporter periplasmic adaptor subunit [Acidobacteriaceae bacterium]|jgi:RND family efflux transporter MFP subunit
MIQATQDDPSQPPQKEHGHAPQPRPYSPRKAIFVIVLLLIVAAVVIVSGILPRVKARSTLKDQTYALAPPSVVALPPATGANSSEIALPGNIYAYTDSPIYARTDGYLEKWYFDIGAHVRKGQLLATISTPEVDQQLQQARADLATAQANASLAKVNASRYQGLLTQNAVSKQDTDTFTSQAESTTSTVKSAMANVGRLEQLQSFEKIIAPFDGVITARNVDIGQLINSGAGVEMFHISAIQVLRVYINVPQVYSPAAIPGTIAQLTFTEFPGQSFSGKLVRTARAIDPTSRTLLVEVDVDNRDGKLLPGAYAEVHVALKASRPTFIIPVSTLIFRGQGLQVGTVVKGPNGDQAKLVNITVGQDDGRTIEVISGLNRDSRVIQDPPDSLIDGEPVHVVQPQRQPQTAAGSSSGEPRPASSGPGSPGHADSPPGSSGK